MFQHLKTAAVALGGLGAIALPAGSAFADDWRHQPRHRTHHYSSYRPSYRHRSYYSRSYAYPSTCYAPPICSERVVVRSYPSYYVSEYPRTVYVQPYRTYDPYCR
jgi:hypothetical protein